MLNNWRLISVKVECNCGKWVEVKDINSEKAKITCTDCGQSFTVLTKLGWGDLDEMEKEEKKAIEKKKEFRQASELR